MSADIVVLDGYTINPGDLSWDALAEYGSYEIFDRSNSSDLTVIDRARNAKIVLTNKTVINRNVIESLPELKCIIVLATGYNVVDLEAASENGVLVCNAPAYACDSVAQMAFAHILNHCQHVQDHSTAVKNGLWSQSLDFCFWEKPLIELKGKTIGIIGYGGIGKKIAAIALAFDMHLLVSESQGVGNHGRDEPQRYSIEDVLRLSDFICLSLPLTKETRGMINKKTIDLMKPNAFLINVARGELINSLDLTDALQKGKIAGAGLDVLESEPPEVDNPLLQSENAVITPHIAWATREARCRLLQISIENIKSFINGSPKNVVSC